MLFASVESYAPEIQLDDPDTYPWRRCLTAAECEDLLFKGKIKYMVSFGIEARYILSDESICGKAEYCLLCTLHDKIIKATFMYATSTRVPARGID